MILGSKYGRTEIHAKRFGSDENVLLLIGTSPVNENSTCSSQTCSVTGPTVSVGENWRECNCLTLTLWGADLTPCHRGKVVRLLGWVPDREDLCLEISYDDAPGADNIVTPENTMTAPNQVLSLISGLPRSARHAIRSRTAHQSSPSPRAGRWAKCLLAPGSGPCRDQF